MKALLYILLSCWVFIPHNNATLKGHTLTVSIENLKNSNGKAIITLYNSKGSLPDEKFKRYYKMKNTEIENRNAKVVFNNLPEGSYAVTVLHDENNNGKIDKKFMLPLPKEGVGFSNYIDFGLSNRPNFKDASFNLNSDKTITVKVIYK
ncbi:DUF2141 domain-containing protein [Pareuzebyella sediminis]|jgi:uncharacterized protein (DUF2141 family)|uniref:DUF2141 domain-containing protein n=1 Tax=Pareuzebyella sediminis TaxID=2607998 RepID=UPI0011EF7050|nr:DUF2141 domain-containing protein [Pareuzebyella sediminis]